MVPIQLANFQRDPSWVRYFRFYSKYLREIKRDIQFNEGLLFNCTLCGQCCDFTAQEHRCLLSWADVARWYYAGFYLGLIFTFPAHSIDGFSALAIPTRRELDSGKFLQWIQPFDINNQVQKKFPHLKEELCRSLGDETRMNAENGNCIYLGGDSRCLIHPIRPGACRSFPYMQKRIIQISQDGSEVDDLEMSIPCPPAAFTSGGSLTEDMHDIIRECAEAEAATWAQERISQPEVENLLVEIWREILPKL